jgi:hypothetical protein
MPKYGLFDGVLYTREEFNRVLRLIKQRDAATARGDAEAAAGHEERARELMRSVLAKHKERMHAPPPRPRKHHRAGRVMVQ